MLKKIMLFCLLTAPLFAEESLCEKKIYCSSEQLEVTDSTILIHLEEGLYEADCVEVDQGGIFVCEQALRCTYCRRPININHVCEFAGSFD